MHGPYLFDKTSKFVIFNICDFRCIDVSFYLLFHYIYSRISKWRQSAILDFKIFAIFVKNANLRPFLRRQAKFGEDRTILGRVSAYFQNGGRPPSWIWYDVISDHPRLAFAGPNIVLKLHVDRFLGSTP